MTTPRDRRNGFTVIAALLLLASCSTGDRSYQETVSTSEVTAVSSTMSMPATTTNPTSTTTLPASTTALPSKAEATAVFDGEQCIYDGSDEFPLNTTIAFSFMNTSADTEAGLSIWQVPDGRTTEDIVEHGILGVGTHLLTDMKATAQPTPPGTETYLEVMLDTPGSYAVNCFVPDGGTGIDYPARIVTVLES